MDIRKLQAMTLRHLTFDFQDENLKNVKKCVLTFQFQALPTMRKMSACRSATILWKTSIF